MSTRPPIVIVGAGLAGAKAAEAVRAEGYSGRLVLIGAEEERPYERPALSKGYLQGTSSREELFVHPEGFYAEHDIELLTGTAVTAIDPAASEVALGTGARMRFDRLLIATGAEPRWLGGPGSDLDGVLWLRDLRDADGLRRRMERAGRALVVGAGWIGCEVAASLRQAGLEVTVLEPASVPLARVLGPEMGGVYRDLHRDHGVEMLLGTGLAGLQGHRSVERALTTDGRLIDCDLVVVGIGVRPRAELAAAAGLATGPRGVLVDAHGRTSAPRIFAAGDVVDAEHPLFARRLHVEHWANALNQGAAAGRSMLGVGEPYARVPYFYSDQYDVGMEYSGHAEGGDRLVVRGDPARREFVAFWLGGDRVLAGMSVNVWDVTEPIQTLVRERVPVDAAVLADPDVPLERIAAGAPRGAAR